MTKATYTKIVKSANYNDTSMSIGFRRYLCLPNDKKLKANVAAYSQIGKTDTHDYIVDFFGKMSELEYQQYIMTH